MPDPNPYIAHYKALAALCRSTAYLRGIPSNLSVPVFDDLFVKLSHHLRYKRPVLEFSPHQFATVLFSLDCRGAVHFERSPKHYERTLIHRALGLYVGTTHYRLGRVWHFTGRGWSDVRSTGVREVDLCNQWWRLVPHTPEHSYGGARDTWALAPVASTNVHLEVRATLTEALARARRTGYVRKPQRPQAVGWAGRTPLDYAATTSALADAFIDTTHLWQLPVPTEARGGHP